LASLIDSKPDAGEDSDGKDDPKGGCEDTEKSPHAKRWCHAWRRERKFSA